LFSNAQSPGIEGQQINKYKKVRNEHLLNKLNTYQINRYEKVKNEHLSNKNKDAILATNL
jgi:hypothetical protein